MLGPKPPIQARSILLSIVGARVAEQSDGSVIAASTFTAKNGLGLELKYEVACQVNGSGSSKRAFARLATKVSSDRLCFDSHRERAMKPCDVITIFERLKAEGRAAVDLEDTCAGFAGWLAEAWDRLDDDEIALLSSVKATLWRGIRSLETKSPASEQGVK